MNAGGFKVVQVSPRVQARGGIEALHLHHRVLPLRQEFVALVDRAPEARAGYFNLNFNWRTTLGQMRREFAHALAPHAGSLVIYHNTWSLPLLHGGDGAWRRVALCHAMPAFHRPTLMPCAGLLDGVMAVTPALAAALPDMLPELRHERAVVLPLPIEPPADLPPTRSDGEIVLGYAGRLLREHKRLDRLPEFIRELAGTGLRHRFELLGDGPLRRPLERELHGRVRFHGWVPKAEFWRVLAGWDAVVFFTEVEGGPIAMLEGMAAGAIPFFPRMGGSMGDIYAPQVHPRCYYAPGDLRGLAENIRWVFTQPAADIGAWREKAQSLVSRHTVENYGATLIGFTEKIWKLSRVSKSEMPARRHWSDVLPLGLVTRTMPGLLSLRRRVQ